MYSKLLHHFQVIYKQICNKIQSIIEKLNVLTIWLDLNLFQLRFLPSLVYIKLKYSLSILVLIFGSFLL